MKHASYRPTGYSMPPVLRQWLPPTGDIFSCEKSVTCRLSIRAVEFPKTHPRTLRIFFSVVSSDALYHYVRDLLRPLSEFTQIYGRVRYVGPTFVLYMGTTWRGFQAPSVTALVEMRCTPTQGNGEERSLAQPINPQVQVLSLLVEQAVL